MKLRFSLHLYVVYTLLLHTTNSYASIDIFDRICQRSEPEVVNIQPNVKNHRKYILHQISLREQSEEPVEYSIDILQSKSVQTQKAPLLIIYPGLSGQTILDISIAKFFIDKGFHVAIVHYYDRGQSETIAGMSQLLVNTMKMSLQLVDYISSDSSFPSHFIYKDKITMLGISYGAIRAAHHISFDSRIHGTILSVGGHSMADILIHTKMPFLLDLKKLQMQNENIANPQEYNERVQQDPFLNLGNLWAKRNNSNVGMIISDKDKWVPTKTQNKLWSMLNQPDHIRVQTGHVFAANSTRWYIPTLYSFLHKTLQKPNPNRSDLCSFHTSKVANYP